jgi:hypothetical protein
MRPDLTIVSPLSVAEALDRLRARGRQWKESTVPPALREKGVLRINITVDDRRFRISVWDHGARMGVGWSGVVIDAPDGQPGSRLLARPYTAGLTPPIAGALVIGLSGVLLYSGAGWPNVAFAACALTVMFTIMHVIRETMTPDMRSDVFAVLLATVDAVPLSVAQQRTNPPPVQDGSPMQEP